jgi:hypothetical protein
MRRLILVFWVVAGGALAAPAFGQTCDISPASEDFKWEQVEDGIDYATWSSPADAKKQRGPLFAHVLRVDLSDNALTLRSLRPLGRSQRIEQIAQFFRDGGVDVRAGINGDYFDFLQLEKDPLGMHVSGGQLLHFPAKTSSFVIDEENRAHIGVYDLSAQLASGDTKCAVNGAGRKAAADEAILWSGYYSDETLPQPGCSSLNLARTELTAMLNSTVSLTSAGTVGAGKPVKIAPKDFALVVCGKAATCVSRIKKGDSVTLDVKVKGFPKTVMEAISGGPRVLRQGTVVEESGKEGFSMAWKFYIPRAHPRTAVGSSEDGKTVYLFVGEGRVKRSDGVTAVQAGCILKAAGASDAMLFDGGGSAVMMVGNGFKNVPRKGKTFTARDLANMLGVVRLRKQ